MAHTAKRTTNGFELVGNLMKIADNPVDHELTPALALLKGDMVVKTAGLVAKAAANAANVLGVMAESITGAAGATTKGKVYTNPFNIYRCSFTDHLDSTATGGTTTTLIDTALATSNNDVWNGALLYIYEGPGAGCIRTVKDYVGSTDTLTVEEPFTAAPTTASKYILLGSGTAADGINVGSVGVDLKDENTIDANATLASEAGPLVVLAIDAANLTMDVMVRKHLLNGI